MFNHEKSIGFPYQVSPDSKFLNVTCCHMKITFEKFIKFFRNWPPFWNLPSLSLLLSSLVQNGFVSCVFVTDVFFFSFSF